MSLENKRNCVLAILVVLLVLTLLFPFHVRVFVDIFAIGLSDVKLLAFPIFALMLAVLYYSKPNNLDYCQTARKILILLFVLFTAGILFYVYLVLTSGVDGFYRFYAVRDGFVSSSLIGHIHAFKPVVGWFLESLPQLSYTFDFGYPILAFIPAYAYMPFTLLLFYLIYLVYKFVPNISAKLDYSIGLFFPFAVSLFTVFKNIVDGGLLNTQLTLSMAVFAFLLYFRREDSFYKKTAKLISLIILFALLQLCLQVSLTAFFNKSLTANMVSSTLDFMISDGNIYASIGLLLIMWISSSLLDRKQNAFRLVGSVLLFTVLFSFFTLILNQFTFSDNPVEYSIALLNAVQKSYRINSSISFLAQKDLKSESDFFTQTDSYPLRQHKIVWGFNTKPVYIPDLYAVSGTPPGRRNERFGCDHSPLGQKEVLFFKVYGFEGNPEELNSSLLSIGKSDRREGEYHMSLNYCVPSKHIVLMEILSMHDSTYILELVTASKQHEEL